MLGLEGCAVDGMGPKYGLLKGFGLWAPLLKVDYSYNGIVMGLEGFPIRGPY